MKNIIIFTILALFGFSTVYAGGVSVKVKFWRSQQSLLSLPRGEEYIKIIDSRLENLSAEKAQILYKRIKPIYEKYSIGKRTQKEIDTLKVLNYLRSKITYINLGEKFTPPIVQTGSQLSVHYIGMLEDKTEFDNSYTKGSPLAFTVGENKMVSGFEYGLMDMQIGEKRTLILSPKEAYGERDPLKTHKVDRATAESMYSNVEFEIGNVFDFGFGSQGILIEITEEDVTFDINHPLVEKTLEFIVEIVAIDGMDMTIY